MAAGSHFGCPKITLYRISYHFRSIPQFLFCEIVLQNGCRRPFWMSENHFRSHFWSFQINKKLVFYFFYKMAAVGHFGCPKFTLDHVSGHFKSIQISFLAISDRYANLIFFLIFDKMAAVGHFGCPKITYDLISIHFTSIRNFIFFGNFWPKWLASAILDVPNSLSIAFRPFQIYRPFWISEIHFRSQFWPFEIDKIFFFPAAILDVWKSIWIAFLANSDWSAILDVRNSLSMAFLAISDPYATFFFLKCFDHNGRRRPFWMGRQCQLSNLSEIFGWVMHVSSLRNVV